MGGIVLPNKPREKKKHELNELKPKVVLKIKRVVNHSSK